MVEVQSRDIGRFEKLLLVCRNEAREVLNVLVEKLMWCAESLPKQFRQKRSSETVTVKGDDESL